MRTCMDCAHLDIDTDGPWSDVTPGEGLVMRCMEKHWILVGEPSKRELKTNLVDAAQGCKDFKEER